MTIQNIIDYYDSNNSLLNIKYSHNLSGDNMEYMEEWWELCEKIQHQWDLLGLDYEDFRITFLSRLGSWLIEGPDDVLYDVYYGQQSNV